jgi:Tfp pilus assembly protein PilF
MTHLIYGSFLAGFGLLKEAERELKKALEIQPNMTMAYVWLAKTYDKAGNTQSASECARKAAEMGYKGNLLEGIAKKVP